MPRIPLLRGELRGKKAAVASRQQGPSKSMFLMPRDSLGSSAHFHHLPVRVRCLPMMLLHPMSGMHFLLSCMGRQHPISSNDAVLPAGSLPPCLPSPLLLHQGLVHNS